MRFFATPKMAETSLNSPPAEPEPQDLTGRTIGRFVIRARLGQGAMGEVYRADDTRLKRPVALKRIASQLRADPVFRQRLAHEAELASRLNDPHIAAVYDIFEAGRETFLVMEYVDGETLRERLRRRLSLAEFFEVATQCAAGVVSAHERGILHCDIKPANIVLTPKGQVKILDFGLAKRLPGSGESATLASGGQIFRGTPAYTAPEVLLEKGQDARSDIFSLGVVLYEMLAGRNPHLGDSFVATCHRITDDEAPPVRSANPLVSPELDEVVKRMLAKEPDERYASAAELLADLRAAAEKYPAGRRLSLRPRLGPRRRWLVGAAALVAVVVLLVGLAAMPSVREQVKAWLNIPPVPQQKQLAVLPFTAVGGPEAAAFSAGLTETLTAKLTQLTSDPTLLVVPATEVQARRIATIEQARKELGVNLVLEGSLLRSGNQVRVNCILVDARTDRQLRAESVTVAGSDPFAVQDQVVSGAVAMLALALQPREREALQAHGTRVAGAYDLYLEGSGYLQNYDRPENIENAIRAFEGAVSLDPNYARAFAGLGEAYWMKYRSNKETRWVASSQQACGRALSLDSKLPAAHVCLGTLYKGTGHYQEAAVEFGSALETEPTNDDAYRELAETYELLGKPAEAEKTYRRAIELRPHYWVGYSWLGTFYYHQARYREAAEMFSRVVTLVPDNIRGYYNLASAYLYQGRYTEAITAAERSIAIQPTGAGYSDLATGYFYLRRYSEAVRAYEQAVKFGEGDADLWWNLGDGYYWTPGKRAQAAGAYQRAIALEGENLRMNPKDANALSALAVCQAMLGEKKAALGSLQKGLQVAPVDPELRFRAAVVYNQFGDLNLTLRWLKKALAVGYSAAIARDTPNFDSLRDNPRFQELLQAK